MCTANRGDKVDRQISGKIEPRGAAANRALLLVGVIALFSMGIAGTAASVYVALTSTSHAVGFLTLIAILGFIFGGRVLQALLDERKQAKLTPARLQ